VPRSPVASRVRASSSRRPARCAPRARRMVNTLAKSTPVFIHVTASGAAAGRSAADVVRTRKTRYAAIGGEEHRFEREKDDHPSRALLIGDVTGAPLGDAQHGARAGETASHRRAQWSTTM